MSIELIVHGALWQGKAWDILVADGRIRELLPTGQSAINAKQTIDANGLHAFPSMIDAHVHLRDPGQEYKEDIKSGLKAAACGGFGAVMAMANTRPVNDSAATTVYIQSKARTLYPHGPHLYLIGALSKGLRGEELAPLGELVAAGCKAISNDGQPVPDNHLFRRAVEYAADLGVRVIDHCEDPGLTQGGVMNEGRVSCDLGLKGTPVVAESVQVARDILLAEYLDLPIHLAHISCAQSVELIAWAKKRGVKITAETCPHYLHWDDSLVQQYNTLAKVNPPLRTKNDVEAIRQAVREGIIDILVTDHAPHAIHEKELPFDEAANGLSGLDTAWGLTLSLVQEGHLSLADAHRLWCETPAGIFSLPCSSLRLGNPASFFLYAPDSPWLVSPENMYSKGKNTPCLGQNLPGRIQIHIINGHVVFDRNSQKP